jgi:hypothetical protein
LAILPTGYLFVTLAAMKADLVMRERLWLTDDLKVEIVIWRLPQPVLGSLHSFKYRMALVSNGICVLRYDNEAGKGDHKHVDEVEVVYHFVDLTILQEDFRSDVERWRQTQ